MSPADVVVVVAAVLLATLGGWPVTAGVLRLAARSADAGPGDARDGTWVGPPAAGDDAADGDAAGDPEPHRPAGPDSARARDVLRGGTWIGLLERLGVAAAVLVGEPTAIAFVIAVKGLGRYPELRTNPEASERFVIGTLASMTWATGVALAARALLG